MTVTELERDFHSMGLDREVGLDTFSFIDQLLVLLHHDHQAPILFLSSFACQTYK